jgi:hypothetical protein
MIWEGAIRAEMVEGWTNEAVENLIEALNNSVEGTFCINEAEEIERNPLLRLVLDM